MLFSHTSRFELELPIIIKCSLVSVAYICFNIKIPATNPDGWVPAVWMEILELLQMKKGVGITLTDDVKGDSEDGISSPGS